jgi:hypothetical protein
MGDAEAAEIAVIDNLQRVDVPALEEAEAFNALLFTLGTAEAIAARVGKPVAHVAKRLKLCSLGAHQRAALAARLITVDHALLLARLGIEEQDANLKWALDRNAGSKTSVEKVVAERIERRAKEGKRETWHWEPESPQRLKEHIEQHSGRKLSRAPWDLEDAELLPAAGPCSTCPQNTKANAALFADLAIEAATCSDGACFETKRAAFVKIRIKDIGAGNPEEILRLSWKQTTTEPRMTIGEPCKGPVGLNNFTNVPKLTQLFKHGQWIEAKKDSCKNILAGVTVDWSDANDRGYMGSGEKLRKPGQILSVCVAPKCKAHKKSWEKAKEPAANGLRNENSEAARAERERKAEHVKAENAVRAELVTAAISKVDKLTGSVLRRLVLMAVPDKWSRVGGADEMFPGLDKGLTTLKTESVEFARAAACVLFIEEQSDVWVSEWEPVDKGRKEFIALLKDLGYDASKAWSKLVAPKAGKSAEKSAKKPAAKKAATVKKKQNQIPRLRSGGGK